MLSVNLRYLAEDLTGSILQMYLCFIQISDIISIRQKNDHIEVNAQYWDHIRRLSDGSILFAIL